ncbi:MAG: hypothetical protein WGN25_19390 [Candidatus Electrothrix sp. GW3-4]|uniref:hypothetical protein n=1 Tax=Candidatus Electrothrix sp. GW3-4 TaxID=3126740 RepID=UPI0030CB59F9
MNLFRSLCKQPACPPLLTGLNDDDDQSDAAVTIRQWWPPLLCVLLLMTGYYFLVLNCGLLQLELETDTRTVFKVYWPNKAGNFSESNMTELLIEPGKRTYSLRVNNTAQVGSLRLDPSEKTAWITIKELRIKQWGYSDYLVHNRGDFTNLEVISGVESLTRHDQGVTIQVKSKDPQLKLHLPSRERLFSPLTDPAEAARLFFVALLALAGYVLFRSFFDNSFFLPVLGATALGLIVTMALISDFNTHPDEYVHVTAGKYFTNHTLPPKVCDPAITDTYSAYGVSRLHSGEIIYLLAGKYLRLLQPLYVESFFLLRLLNVLLFGTLVFLAFHKQDFRFFLLPFLISPQIWYIFSYFNSDAFATFISLLAAYQLAGKNSALTSLAFSEQPKHTWIKIACLGLLLGFLLLLKQNFYFLYLFLFLYFFWKVWVMRPHWNGKKLFRLAAVLLIGCSVFTGVHLTDAWVNDFNKGELLFEARRQYADKLFNPDTPIEKRHAYLEMRKRGTSLEHFLAADRWGEKSFRTSFGVYGYTQYSGSFTYYDYVRYIGIALLLTLIISIAYRGQSAGILLLTISAGTALLLIVVACWHAWTVDFQAQGRYFLPLIPMTSILFYHCRRIIFRPLFYILFFALFSLSVYNFILVGLRDIGKYGM